MAKSWNLLCLYFGPLFCQLCNGLPINLENTAADSHTQLLTGLVAVLLTVCSVVFLAGCLCCRRKNGFQDEKKEFRDSPVVVSTSSSNLDHGHVNPVANGEFTIFTPLSPLHQNNNVFLASQQVVIRTEEDYGYGDVDVSSWFNGQDNDFPRSRLKYIREIGKGWFGRVVEGAAQDTDTNQQWAPVVVRILEATASSKERAVFLHDASIYRCGTHPNILGLIGRCLDTIPLLLLQEYCPKGDLKNYLKQNKSNVDKFLSTEYPLIWCCQLTSALKHLHDNKLTHTDLAARNCQLTADLTLKLGDYGLAVFQYPDDYYQGVPGVSVRWCAPESLTYTSTTIQPNKLTLASNIWSLGVTLWEICECGEQPYSDLTDDEVISQVLDARKVRLPRPKFQVLYTDYIFRLMQLCWTNSESRPGVVQIDLMLNDLLQVHKNTKTTQSPGSVSVEDFDKRWDSLKPNSIVKTDNHHHIAETNPTDVDIDNEIVSSKPLSPSLNNLHGSLDNLLTDNNNVDCSTQMESWLENVATKTGDLTYVQGLSEAIKDLDNTLAFENVSSSDSSHQQSPGPDYLKIKPTIEFKLGPINSNNNNNNNDNQNDLINQNDSLTDSMVYVQRTSSGSETEEENWKTKIERGAYTEKVRQKSQSVADLMILTHIEPSESESETPLPSLDYRMNYKNVRYAPKNLENISLMFGSEGNLLSVKDTFEEELKKLQEERRDSLLFVPETNSQNNNNNNNNNNSNIIENINDNIIETRMGDYVDDSPSRRLLMQELNDTSEIKPANQVFNVFNVTIDQFSPVHLTKTIKLDEIIHFNDDCQMTHKYQVPTLLEIAQNSLLNHSVMKNSETMSENLPNITVEPTKVYNVPKLVDLIQDNDELMDYIIAKYEDETVNNTVPENCETDGISKELISQCSDFLLTEIDNYDSPNLISNNNSNVEIEINFDLSQDQEQTIPNSLTHSNLFNQQHSSLQDISTKFSSQDDFLSLNLFCETEKRIEDANIEETTNSNENNLGLYSLETWDNFLQTTLNNQNSDENSYNNDDENGFFDSFSSEPQSLLFIDNNNDREENDGSDEMNKTFICDQDNGNSTFTINDSNVDINDIHLDIETSGEEPESWENNSGWFLHSQSQGDEVSGEMVISSNSDSYVGFNVDDEIMAAIRTELLNKLPQAQGGSSVPVQDDEEWDSSERNEIILHYNVYNTPLSPIPEESQIEEISDCEFDESLENTPRKQPSDNEDDDDENSDWSEHEQEILPHDTASHSPQTQESPIRGHLHRHTPSQDSCCSNDTLFNLEELTCATNDNLHKNESQNNEIAIVKMEDSMNHPNVNIDSNLIETVETDQNIVVAPLELMETSEKQVEIPLISDKSCITEFIMKEREFCIKVNEPLDESISEESTTDLLSFSKNQVAPLPSPEDKPWKQLAQSLLTNNKLPNSHSNNEQVGALYENINRNDVQLYENIVEPSDIYNEADYVNIVNLENTKNTAEFSNKNPTQHNIIEDDDDDDDNNNNEDDDDDEIPDSPEYVNSFNGKNSLIINSDNDDDTFRILTDIRFTGPSDSQMMSTSFSESNDLNDEPDWDSGSDTRSSSSGEFIWKEGEHEESLKALRAAPHDMLDDIKPMGDIHEDTSETSTSGSEEDDGESPEFVPSAWDKYATPTKSALRSPEKTLEKTEKKKSRGVWFKKQKYHCVYEYPREPDSPILHSYDLWKPQDYSTFADWDLDLSDTNIQTKDDTDLDQSIYQQKTSRNQNLYQLSSVPDFMSNHTDDEFFITSSSKPFDKINSSTSQFFPGNWTNLTTKQNDNITPDSGVEDITTPGAINDNNFTNKKLPSKSRNVPSLKYLASEAVNRTKKIDETRTNDVLGGLRHTRNKLKLDLPPSPSAFTSTKMFTIEPILDPVINRETPTFTTFGKSRFLVQHVDTPPDEIAKQKNVSFEAIPYKPFQQIKFNDNDNNDNDLIVEKSSKGKIEIVRGEASLLDSADEDSGIESSTLERKLNTIEAKN